MRLKVFSLVGIVGMIVATIIDDQFMFTNFATFSCCFCAAAIIVEELKGN